MRVGLRQGGLGAWFRTSMGLVLLASALLGCTAPVDPHAESIPDIPPGRSRVGPEAGEQRPVAPPGK